MKRKGFTIIELIIASSIVVLLTMVALPNFSKLSDSQTFTSSVQKVANCIRKAQQEAANPLSSAITGNTNNANYNGDSPTRNTSYSLVHLYKDGNQLSCSRATYGGFSGYKNEKEELVSTSSPLANDKVFPDLAINASKIITESYSDLSLCKVSTNAPFNTANPNPSPVSTPQDIYILFSAPQQGLPTAIKIIGGPTPFLYTSSPGIGFDMTLQVANLNTNGSGCSQNLGYNFDLTLASIYMGQLGSPIQLQ